MLARAHNKASLVGQRVTVFVAVGSRHAASSVAAWTTHAKGSSCSYS